MNSASGSTRTTINIIPFSNIEIYLPFYLSEQCKIAEIMENVDETLEKTDAIIKKYKRIKQGLMQDLFTKGITAFEFEKDKIINTVKKVFDNGDHRFGREENLVSHLSKHLENFFPEWAVDSEVEKNNERQRPDIIIHKRGTDNNLFAIEVKKNDYLNTIKEDIKKLENVMLEDYQYEDAIFIGFDIENFEDVFKLSEKVNFILVSKNGEIKVKARVSRFKNSPLGKIPEEWEVLELREVGKFQYGFTTSATNEDTGIKFLRITDIQGGNVFWHDVPFCMINRNDIKTYKIEAEDILFARTGATTGKTYLIKKISFLAIFASYLIKIKIDDTILSKFLFYFLNSDKYWKQIATNLSGSTQEGFNASKLKKLVIPRPILPEQRRIVSILSQIDETIEKEQKYKEKLERIKQGLMEDLLTGEVRTSHLIKEGVESVQKT